MSRIDGISDGFVEPGECSASEWVKAWAAEYRRFLGMVQRDDGLPIGHNERRWVEDMVAASVGIQWHLRFGKGHRETPESQTFWSDLCAEARNYLAQKPDEDPKPSERLSAIDAFLRSRLSEKPVGTRKSADTAKSFTSKALSLW